MGVKLLPPPAVSGSFLGHVPQCTKFPFIKNILEKVKPRGGSNLTPTINDIFPGSTFFYSCPYKPYREVNTNRRVINPPLSRWRLLSFHFLLKMCIEKFSRLRRTPLARGGGLFTGRGGIT